MDKARREKMIRQAAEWLCERDLPRGLGAVIFWRGKVCGWTRELTAETANRHMPGCIALDVNGNFFKAVGGNDMDGAEQWRLVHGKVVELPKAGPAPTSLDRALDAVEEMSDADAIASLDPLADADVMQSALVLAAGKHPAAGDMLKVLAARGRQRCRDWEIVLDGMSPHASADDLLTLFITGPAKAPSMSWLGGYIKRMQQVAA